MTTLSVTSRSRCEMIDITSQVREAIRASGVVDGLALIYTPHTTAAITINENADPDVVHDMLNGLDQLVPLRDGYRHAEGNSAAHIKSSLFGASETLIVENGQTQLGTWQGVYFCEFDGPRSRKVLIKLMVS